MTQLHVDPRDRAMILTHYYRAMVGRADVWRTRMDTTTNWAIGATAAVISFTLGNPQVPHYVAFIASLMTVSFLLLEARRLTFYHLWQQRVLQLEDSLVRPALEMARSGAPNTDGPPRATTDDPPRVIEEGDTGSVDAGAALEAGLGRTVPSMRTAKAVARRLRRVYLYLFGVQLLAWVFKLSNHPSLATSFDVFVGRAQLGVIPGAGILATTLALFLFGMVLAFSLGGVDRDPA
jgi:uncharacterized membrane protein